MITVPFPSQDCPQLFFAEFEFTVFCIDESRLAFAHFAVENIDRERVENFSLNGAPQRTRAINWVIAFAREQFLG